MATWPRKIEALKRLISEIGSIWPAPSTTLAGYATDGPYHCEDCVYMKRHSDGFGRCNQPVMMADRQVKHDADGTAIVNIEKGCCEFVEPPRG